MFRIETFCDDRKLGDVLRALSGKVIGQPTIQPVINAEKTEGKKPTVKAQGDNDVSEMLIAWLKQKGLQTFKAPVVYDFLKEHGRSKGSYSYVLKRAVALGLITKHKGKNNQDYTYSVK